MHAHADNYLDWSSCRNLHDAMVDYFTSDPLVIASHCAHSHGRGVARGAAVAAAQQQASSARCSAAVRELLRGGVVHTGPASGGSGGPQSMQQHVQQHVPLAQPHHILAGQYRVLTSRRPYARGRARADPNVRAQLRAREESGTAGKTPSTFAGNLLVLQDKWNSSVWLPFTSTKYGAFREDRRLCNPGKVLCRTDMNLTQQQQAAAFVDLVAEHRRRTNRSSTRLKFGRGGFVLEENGTKAR